MLVTMFTDASWHSRTKTAVWAVWAKCDGKTIRYGGKFNQQMLQIGTAELGAISYGLHQIKQDFNPPKESRIICQTDCAEAITGLTNNKHKRDLDTKIIKHIKDFANSNGWRLDIRYVQAHKGDATPRNAVNTWCDEECQRQMALILGPRKTKRKVKETKDNSNVIMLRQVSDG